MDFFFNFDLNVFCVIKRYKKLNTERFESYLTYCTNNIQSPWQNSSSTIFAFVITINHIASPLFLYVIYYSLGFLFFNNRINKHSSRQIPRVRSKNTTQQTSLCSNSMIGTLAKGVLYVQINKKYYQNDVDDIVVNYEHMPHLFLVFFNVNLEQEKVYWVE